MERLKDKVCIITGANSGFGEEMTRLFAKEGGKIIAADYNPDIMNKYTDSGFEITPVLCDVTKEDEVKNMVNVAREKYGRLDVLCNNAGINNKKSAVYHAISGDSRQSKDTKNRSPSACHAMPQSDSDFCFTTPLPSGGSKAAAQGNR